VSKYFVTVTEKLTYSATGSVTVEARDALHAELEAERMYHDGQIKTSPSYPPHRDDYEITSLLEER